MKYMAERTPTYFSPFPYDQCKAASPTYFLLSLKFADWTFINQPQLSMGQFFKCGQNEHGEKILNEIGNRSKLRARDQDGLERDMEEHRQRTFNGNRKI